MKLTEPTGVDQDATASGRASDLACPLNSVDSHAAKHRDHVRGWGWTPIRSSDLRESILQWSTGLLATMLGAQMLIVPHQLSTQAYDLVRPQIGLWGGAMLVAGILMLVVAATGRSRWLVLTAHLGLGALLLFLGAVFAATGGWFGGTIFAVLGLATVVAPSICRAPRAVAGASDLFTVSIGTAFAVIGVVVVVVPELLVAPAFEWLRPYARWFGV